jgi:ssDNA-binding Zn-finger/Zn-ribbon topoisomerase 1
MTFMQEAPACSKCGKEMVLKTAKKGENVGHDFWGCSGFPDCRNTLNYSDDEATQNKEIEPDKTIFNDNIKLPIDLVAREKYRGYNVRFFQTVAIPFAMQKSINSNHELAMKLQKQSVWRLDLPHCSNRRRISNIEKLVFAQANKLLTRGMVTLISPYAESRLQEYYGLKANHAEVINDFDFMWDHINLPNQSDLWFDGNGTEKKFYEEILPSILGQGYSHHVIPQVQFLSLIKNVEIINDNEMYQRIDFLVSYDNIKAVVEIDGDEYQQHDQLDQQRDELLIRNGYRTFRIPNHEIQSGLGINLIKLTEELTGNKYIASNNYSSYKKYLISAKLVHQIELSIIETMMNGIIDKSNNTALVLKSRALEPKNIEEICSVVNHDLKELFENLNILYGTNNNNFTFSLQLYNKEKPSSLIISFDDSFQDENPVCYISDLFFDGVILQESRCVDDCASTM